MDNIKRNPERRNYTKIGAAIEFIEQRLAPYTEQKVRETHQDIYKKMAGHPACTQNCSVVYPNNTISWCNSCNSWRRHLAKCNRNTRRIIWENVNSSDWPKDPFNIIGVFITNFSKDGFNHQDLSTACHIWSNMNSCRISPALIKRIQRERNSFAHNSFYSTTLIDMSKAFDTFRDLVKDPDVAQHIDTRDTLKGLSDIEAGVGEDKQLQNIEQVVQINRAESKAMGIKVEQCLQTVKNIDKRYNQNVIQQCSKFFSVLCRRIWTNVTEKYPFPCFIVLVLVFFTFSLKPVKDILYQEQECVSEQFHMLIHQDLPLLPYLSDHSRIVGRKWLFTDLHKSIISHQNRTNKKGVILIAEMGYGKSAIISELICPKSTQNNVKRIRKHIVGFHVCKFDVKATHDVRRFILRFTGFLALKSAEFGNIFNMLSEYSLPFDKEGCNKEPIACFDQAVLHPLKQLKDIQDKPWIYIIDALDECALTLKSDILQLLISRIKYFPWWIKVIITSRNETYLSSFRRMDLQYLDPNDIRNKDDLKTFINMKLPASPTKFKTVDELVAKSDGNFVYVVQAVTWLLSFPNTSVIPELPSDIAHVYEINFDRQFETAAAYTVPKMILEITCSTVNPIGKDDIYNILTENNVSINRAEFNYHFHRLSFFLNTDIDVRVKHQALFAWLTDGNNKYYQIELNRGHSYISKYLFGNMQANKQIDFVDLAIHVGMSNDTQLQKIFLSSKLVNETMINKDKTLHKLVWQTTSVKPLELILSQIEFVDGFNEGNITAAFVAAAKGNLEQLKLLQRKGADMNFQTFKDIVVGNTNISATIERIKNVYYSGFTLLHIACQHGHLNVVEYLLRYNRSLLYVKNSLGMHAGHIACERGHVEIIKTMYTFNASIFDFDCLYYSSKNNHIDVVKWLVSTGVKYKCISDSMSRDALHAITSIHNHTFKLPDVFFNISDNVYLITPLDRWWVVLKTDPLLESIQRGSFAIANLIIKTFPNSKTCHDAFGFTPALASVVYNRTELFPMLLDHILNDTCHKTPPHIAESNVPYVQQMLSNSICPESGNLAHVLALYSSLHQLYYFELHHLNNIQWKKPDKLKIYPLHYAVSKNNLQFVQFYAKQFQQLDDIRTKNGSSAYHIASICGLPQMFHVLFDSLKSVPQIKDKNGQGILHYIVQRSLNAYIAETDTENSKWSYSMFYKVINEFSNDLMGTDTFKRNVLHYALRFGHFDIVHYIKVAHNSKFKQMLRQKDKDGYQPLEFAVKNYHKLIYTMVFKQNCTYYEYFLSSCTPSLNEAVQFLSPWEMSLLHVISTMTYTEFELMLEPHLSIVWQKSAHLMTAVMSFHNYRNTNTLRKLIIGSNHTGVTKYNQLLIFRYVPSVFIVCDQALDLSPLHYTMLKFHEENTILSFSKNDQIQILKRLLYGSGNAERLSCKDKNGLNIFHYALLGGKIDFARLIMENGITIVDNKLSLKDVLIMALQGRLSETIWSNTPRDNIDNFLVDILTLHENKLVLSDVCTNSTVDLSLIHLLAQNGMLKTIQLLVQMFSSSILYCRNVDRLTPMYLGKLFGHDNLLHHFKEMSKMVYPDHSVEQLLLVFLMDGFPEMNSVNPFACTNIQHSFIHRRKWYWCIKSLIESLHLIQHISFIRKKVIVSHDLDTVEYVQLLQNLILNHIIKASRKITVVPDEIVSAIKALERSFSFVTSQHNKKRNTHLMIVNKNIFTSFKRFGAYEFVEKHTLEMSRLTYLAIRKLITIIRHDLQNDAIQYYLQGKLSLARTMSDNYSFLAERFLHHGFNISRQYTDPVVLFDQKITKNFRHFRYLNVLKSTLSYKLLRKDIFVDDRFFSNYSHESLLDLYKILSQKIMSDTLKEPFVDLKRKP